MPCPSAAKYVERHFVSADLDPALSASSVSRTSAATSSPAVNPRLIPAACPAHSDMNSVRPAFFAACRIGPVSAF